MLGALRAVVILYYTLLPHQKYFSCPAQFEYSFRLAPVLQDMKFLQPATVLFC